MTFSEKAFSLFIIIIFANFLQECKSCHGNIEIDTAYVMAFNLGDEASWHPGCFKCSKCSELLMNLTFFHCDGEIYCGRHYAENTKPRCAACDEVSFATFLCLLPCIRKEILGHAEAMFTEQFLAPSCNMTSCQDSYFS